MKFSASSGDQLEYNGSQGACQVDQTKQRKLLISSFAETTRSELASTRQLAEQFPIIAS